MRHHLSEDQLSMCILGRAAAEELQHGRECPQCKAQLERFHEPVSTFRAAMQDWSDRESVSRLAEISWILAKPRWFSDPLWLWAPVAITVMLLTGIPIYIQQQKLYRAEVTEATHEDVLLMDAINMHLSRPLPAPMEPIMALIPEEKTVIQSGGIK